ncbi:MAG: outer membrane beta-barrel family protein, partial [Candidatus Amulumruptor sp.]
TPNVSGGMDKQLMSIVGTGYPTPIFSYYFDNAFALPHGWTITVNLSGQSSGDMHTNHFGRTWLTMDASVSKSLLSNALTLSLSATDIFNTANTDWTMHTYGIQVAKHQSYDRRGISLNITYRLHSRKSKYKGTSASESELRRL